MKEEWRAIPGWEDLYQVSNTGRIKSLTRTTESRAGRIRTHKGRILTPIKTAEGYFYVNLCRNGLVERSRAHRLVALAFLGEPETPDLVCCHNNGDRADNRVENLRWDTLKGNYADMGKHGTNHWLNKTQCPRGHQLVSENCAPWQLRKGYRTCWACAKSRALARKRNESDFYQYADFYYEQLTG